MTGGDGMGGVPPRSYRRVPDVVIASWDRVSAAIDAMVVAQPSRMTEAAERLRQAQAEHMALIIQESRHGC
ncbi:hypothetical protein PAPPERLAPAPP_02990 [Brevundimonas phage vB_BpoS-Papperlapapp]|uniref:Uncharacterized protein n=1 Tax=Brevundimonas phage vB_BpoS-Domovoi TaxID=2948598 RepID=A0A9E7MQP6_9CAUD|nr:hypothetical protein DOMOVOI_01950 [Brevundimonas phage vB_BpoS-Domovoi]USN16040.1 hypothetical protein PAPPERLAPAPP_02990 [Brevundimonas phage vB_BpoS-Papperlapapp]